VTPSGRAAKGRKGRSGPPRTLGQESRTRGKGINSARTLGYSMPTRGQDRRRRRDAKFGLASRSHEHIGEMNNMVKRIAAVAFEFVGFALFFATIAYGFAAPTADLEPIPFIAARSKA
jgi:hypothetical protein